MELGVTLKRQRMETLRTLAVTLCAAGGQHEVRGWVHAYRLNAEQANRARHKCRQGHKKARRPRRVLLFAAGCWSLPHSHPRCSQPRRSWRLYRCRWQVEIAIKRWKSVLDVDALRAKRPPPLAEVWLHGKLLYALMLERRMRRQLGDSWGRLDPQRVGTWWRVWGMLKDEIGPIITGALFWKEDAWAACLKVLVERPRRRTLQRLPPEALDVFNRCEARKTRGHRPLQPNGILSRGTHGILAQMESGEGGNA